jgi:hypothetical protein
MIPNTRLRFGFGSKLTGSIPGEATVQQVARLLAH